MKTGSPHRRRTSRFFARFSGEPERGKIKKRQTKAREKTDEDLRSPYTHPGTDSGACTAVGSVCPGDPSFLSEAEILRIREYVPQAIGGVAHLITAETEAGVPAGFLGIENDRLEMLFLSPGERGKGLGKQLVELGIQQYGVREVNVNEQNPQAVGFYAHLGFET